MNNLKYYTDDAFEFHEEVLNSKNNTKNDTTYKERIGNLKDSIKSQYSVYEHNFTQNTLEKINAHEYTEDKKNDLLKLYSYKNSIISKLKIKITTTETNRIISTCPNCTISEVNSFDHYLPKEEFPEFVVNPKNIFPSCSVCNSYKSTIWLKDNKRQFLNLYLDKLPKEQYLFVNFTIDVDVVTTQFYLQNIGNIEPCIFEVIESHYRRLHLLERFNRNANDIITVLEDTIYSFINKLPIEEIIDAVIEKSNKDKFAFGYNYWKAILSIELVNSVEYMKRFLI